jgi:hypothetical protein
MVGFPKRKWMCVRERERERELAQRRQRWGSEKRTFAWALAHSPVVFIVKMGEKEGKTSIFLVHYNSMVPSMRPQGKKKKN